jgi:hypothetical protein
MPTLPLRTLGHCAKPSPLLFSNLRLSAVGCELPPRLSPLRAALTRSLQPTENKTTLSPFPATLTSRVKPKSFVCHSYKKHGGVRVAVDFFARHLSLVTSATRRNARNSNPLKRLLHNSRTPGVGGYASSEAKLLPSASATCPIAIAAQTLPSASNFQLSTLPTSHHSQVASHGPRVTDHGSRITPP